MAIWGKIFGGVAGFAMGGPVGAALGTALGHAADKGTLLQPPTGGWSDRWAARANPDPNGAATFMAAKLAAALGKKEQLYGLTSIILCAKLAKCDAPVNRREIDAFKMRFRVPDENMREVGRLFDLARQRTDDYESFARELGTAYAQDKQPLEDLMGVLFGIARADLAADEPLTKEETQFLQRVHALFGLSRGAWERAEQGRSRPAMAEEDAYVVMGVDASLSNEELRARWKVLVRQYHPDVMASRKASPAEIAEASAKISRINAAWDMIKRDRGL
ncbi:MULTISPECIES: TerB family tellurite resistance protein [Acetobacter]|mgnify:FL=1|uniref:Molecular chaperone DnaJ n=1 Tax=Acetobacter cerevisiae TaxID=178900 RepID=A0A149V9B4_9PROT|nr:MULTISPECIES: TerB family tellurite resistance protein [Acetobacter]KXV76706.1 molecular chaperone DnaJ [Acetobacter cerevisiae]MCP1270718.1 TerB family tellurite resistance protein [Acetobacter cerevisiae]MCP1278647.1 TerB family tellurite resistance protein [Acetobacter cerevisiae]